MSDDRPSNLPPSEDEDNWPQLDDSWSDESWRTGPTSTTPDPIPDAAPAAGWESPPPTPPTAIPTGTGWPTEASYPPVPPAFGAPTWPPLAPARTESPRRGFGAIAAVAIAAALIGGAVGGTIAYNAAEDEVRVSSLGAPVTSDVRAASATPVGAVERVAAKVLPSVVSIDVRGAGAGGPGLAGSGSGVVISSDGLILTNAHVAGKGDLAVTFSDGRALRAKLIKADPGTDLAVIKAAGITDATPISFGNSGALRVGQDVVAIGAPLGLAGTVTTGIISALNRPVVPQQGSDETSVIDGIQTDAPINPGNSGGALVDLNGNLVGVTSAIASLGSAFGGQSGSIGLGFAIPIDQARVIAEQLARGETVAHALLGVQVTSSNDATQRGAVIQEVSNGGAAANAGLRKGDVVTRLDGRLIDTSDALVAGVRSQQPGQKVTLTYLRDGRSGTAEVILGSDAE